jgi:hypothetical protein
MPFDDLSLLESPSQRRAKIVATLGPSSNTEPVIREMVRAGVDVVRLNFSHGSHERKAAVIEKIRKVSREERKPLCILGDLQGPKIRTTLLKDHQPVLLKADHRLTITARDVLGTASLVGTTFKTLAENVEQGSRILLSDGLIELRVHEVDGEDVVCDIVNGGLLGEYKGINLPGVLVRTPSLTEKDSIDLEFALNHDFDAIAVSFVRSAEDVALVRHRVAAHGASTWIVAKLEKPQAVEHLESILQVADGIMVARGDLGVEVPPEKVPAIQKHIIRRAAEYFKPVITATQMLESMIENPRPTPPTTWTCAASRSSPSPAPLRANSPNTTPPRPSSRSARSGSPSIASTCCGAPRPSAVPRSTRPKPWWIARNPCSRKAATSGRARSSPLWPAPAPSPAQPTSSACMPWARTRSTACVSALPAPNSPRRMLLPRPGNAALPAPQSRPKREHNATPSLATPFAQRAS